MGRGQSWGIGDMALQISTCNQARAGVLASTLWAQPGLGVVLRPARAGAWGGGEEGPTEATVEEVRGGEEYR